MVEILFQFVLNIVTTIINFVMSPFLNALFTLFPSLQVYFNHIISFFGQALTYISTVLQWFLFTPSMFSLLFDYFIIKYTIYILIIAVRFAINIYNKLKP